MERVPFTIYRKLYRLCRRIDASVAIRTHLTCCPLQEYDHRRMEWRPVDVSAMEWTAPRAFVDAVVRRLNNGRPLYIPPLPEEAARAVEEYREQCATLFTSAAPATATDAPAAAATQASSSTTAAATSPSPSTAARDGADGSAPSAAAAQNTPVPLAVLPFSAPTTALRQIYEATPFSVNNLTTAFAALKELQHICERYDAGKAKLVKVDAAAGASSSSAAGVPGLQRSLDLMPLHHSLIHGLSAEMRVSLEQQTRRAKKRRGAAQKGDTASPATTAAATEAAVAAGGGAPCGGDVLDEASDTAAAKEAETGSASETSAVAAGAGAEAEGAKAAEMCGEQRQGASSVSAAPAEAGQGTTADVAATSSSVLGAEPLPSRADMAKEPEAVQLLLTHPTSRGFFRHTVLLVVRHVSHQSAAFVLNKPMCTEDRQRVSVESAVRLGRVHPIFRRHLLSHTLMLGGPVAMGNSLEENLFLLHRVPGVPDALPLGSSLWLDGDLDALMAALEAKTASADDVVVLYGFSGWGVNQLAGELGNGYWVVTTGPSTDAEVGRFVMSLTTTSLAAAPSGMAAPPPSAVATPSEESAVDAPTAGAAAALAYCEAGAGLSPKRRRRRGNKVEVDSDYVETLPWVRAYASIGHPYAEMAVNRSLNEEDDDCEE